MKIFMIFLKTNQLEQNPLKTKQNIELVGVLCFLYFCGFMALSSIFQFFGLSNDYIGYKQIFTFEYGLKRNNTEPFFIFLRYLNDILFNSVLITILIFTTLFSFFVKWKSFKKISKTKPYLIFICQIFCFFWIQEYTQIRASCAIAIFFSALSDLVNKKDRNYFIKAVIATLFHYSAFTMFVFYIYVRFFKSQMIYILFPIFGFIFSVMCSNLFGSKLRELLWLLERVSGLNKSGNISDFMSPFNSKYLMLLFSFSFNAFFTPKSDKTDSILMKSMSFGLCFYYFFNPIGLPVISVRLAEFYTSVFVMYFFLNIKNIRIKEKAIFKIGIFLPVILYSIASIKTGIL